MASFESVNYSLRPSKNIQRQLVFDGMRLLQAALPLERLVYVGFGSIWFTDFLMAHKLLHIDDMVSIEGDDVGYLRAMFNSPYATVKVERGFSSAVLPKLYTTQNLMLRPWLIWLDYDYDLNESVVQDIRSIIENAPTNILLLITFNGKEQRYGPAAERSARIREVLECSGAR